MAGPETTAAGSQPSQRDGPSIRRRLTSPDLHEPSFSQRIADLFPPREIRDHYPRPTPEDLRYKREVIDRFYPGAKYTLILATEGEGQDQVQRLRLYPSHHPMAREGSSPATSPTGHYGKGWFEGLSQEPTTDASGHLTGGNIVLLDPRMRRWERSIRGRDVTSPIPTEVFKQAYIDYTAILGDGIFGDPEDPSRAYGRPFGGIGNGPMGVATSPSDRIIIGATEWNWPSYFINPEEVYAGGGLTVVVQPNQRSEEITGKHASNYGAAGTVGQRARSLGGDDAMYFATFHAHTRDRSYLFKDQRELSTDALRQQMLSLALADGPGEEVVAFTHDGMMVYPPMDVGRLGGTTLDYVVDHIAPRLGIETKEAYFSIQDILDGKIESLAYIGNAVRIAPIGRLDLRDKNGAPLFDGPIELKHPDMVTNLRRLQQQYEAEVRGKASLSDPSLLTPIPQGPEVDEARTQLNAAFAGWF